MPNIPIERFTAEETTKLVEAMQIIDDNANGILFVISADGKLLGAVSDGDIRRWILKTGSLTATVREVMNKHPKFLCVEDDVDHVSFMHETCVRALPIVDRAGYITDIELLDNTSKPKLTDKEPLINVSAVIMAGGKGTRLYPYTKILPKPLIPIGDVPIMERIVNSLHDYGVKDFIFTVNYRKNMIRSYFNEIEKGYCVEYVEEDKPLGTGGSLKLINRKFTSPIIVTNCDILIKANYADLYTYHKGSGNAITIVTALKNDTIPYGVIQAKENGEIEKMVEKPKRSYFINTGMYVINPEMVGLIPEDVMFHMTHLAEKAMNLGYKVGMYPVSEDSFLDMGEFEEMKRMEEKLNLR